MKLLLLFLMVLPMRAEDGKSTASELDRERLQRIESQMQLLELKAQLIQKQLAEALAPIRAEKTLLLERVCGANQIPVAVCQVDLATGAVSKIPQTEEAKK